MSKATVLVVEDDIHLLSGIREILELDDYSVLTAQNGLQGLDKLQATEAPPDVIVSDIMMPHMDGFILTSEVRKMPGSVNLPIVLVTSLGSVEHREKGVEAGADAYIVKSSFDQGNLLEVIQRLA